jgi:hypothetical protein
MGQDSSLVAWQHRNTDRCQIGMGNKRTRSLASTATSPMSRTAKDIARNDRLPNGNREDSKWPITNAGFDSARLLPKPRHRISESMYYI